MRLTIVSNYINHHQIPMSNALYERLGADFAKSDLSPASLERKEKKDEKKCICSQYGNL